MRSKLQIGSSGKYVAYGEHSSIAGDLQICKATVQINMLAPLKTDHLPVAMSEEQ